MRVLWDCGTWLTWLTRILWAARLSALSGFAGGLLFWTTTQAQDLFADLSTSQTIGQAIRHWLLFYLAVIFAWALPVHYGARLSLNADGWIINHAQAAALGGAASTVIGNVRQTYARTISWTPRCLGLVPFFAVGVGLLYSLFGQQHSSALVEGTRTQTQLSLLLAADAVAGLIFVRLVVVRRRIVEHLTSRGYDDWLDLLRYAVAIGMLVLFVVSAYVDPNHFSTYCARALLIPILFGALLLPLSELQKLGTRFGFPCVSLLLVTSLAFTAANHTFHQIRLLPRTTQVDGRIDLDEAVTRWKEANNCVRTQCPPPLIVAIDGGASRAAFMSATFIGMLLDRVPSVADEAPTPGRRIFALSGVSGGAFGAATIQAALADAQRSDTIRPPCRRTRPTWFGTAYEPNAVATFGEGPLAKPLTWRQCLQLLTTGDYLSPTVTGLAFRDFVAPFPGLRDRAALLEQAFERHYAFATLADTRSFDWERSCSSTSDFGLCRRAARPRDFYANQPHGWLPILLLNATSIQTGRRVITSDVKSSRARPLFPDAFDLVEALGPPCPPPLGTPVPVADQTEQAVLSAASAAGETKRTLRLGTCARGVEALSKGADLRLSTAALTSARFPFVSPEGAFWTATSNAGDQLVDGGYFENSGLTTALDLADAIKDLKPIVLSISNDPEKAFHEEDVAALPARAAITPLVPPPGYGFWTRSLAFLQAPFNTLSATRDGHGAEAEARAQRLSGAGQIRFLHFKVLEKPDLKEDEAAGAYFKAVCNGVWHRAYGKVLDMPDVSMSWWLSAVVQSDLDVQRCSAANRKVMRTLVELIRGSDVAPP